MVFKSSTLCLTMPRSILSLPLSQSTSAHFKARHSLILSPKQTQTSAIVPNGSSSLHRNLWNSSTVRLRGCRVRLEEPLTVYQRNWIGLYCYRPAPHRIVPDYMEQTADVPPALRGQIQRRQPDLSGTRLQGSNRLFACGWRIVISPIIHWNFLSC
jgi:hypothetical protein